MKNRMKIFSIAALFCLFLSLGSSAQAQNYQPYSGTIDVINAQNNPLGFNGRDFLRIVMDSVWNQAIPQACDEINHKTGVSVNRAIGRGIRNPQCRLSSRGSLEILSASLNRFTVRYTIGNNAEDFYVTTPDGLPRSLDPHFSVTFDVIGTATLSVDLNGITVEEAKYKVANAKIDSQNVVADLIKDVNEIIKFFGGRGFFAPAEDAINNQSYKLKQAMTLQFRDINSFIAGLARQGYSQIKSYTLPTGQGADQKMLFQVSRRNASAATSATVSRISNSMETFWIGPNGSVQAAYWYEGSTWKRFEIAPAGSASLEGGIKAVSRRPNTMEVFWIGANGSIQDAYWHEGSNWNRFELAPAGSASTDGDLTVVSRIPNSMEVFWIGANGSIEDAHWYEGSTWKRFQLAPVESASTKGSITSISRISGSMEVFWIGANGSIQDAYFYEGSTWKRFELAPAGSASVKGSIASTSRIPNSMEIFWTGANGSIQDAYFYDGMKQWNRFELASAGSAYLSGTITATSRFPNSLEIFWVGANGSIQDAYWYEGSNWRRFELAPAGSAHLHASIASVSRIPNSMEIMWIGRNGSIQDAYWYEGSNWRRFELAPAGSAYARVLDYILTDPRKGAEVIRQGSVLSPRVEATPRTAPTNDNGALNPQPLPPKIFTRRIPIPPAPPTPRIQNNR